MGQEPTHKEMENQTGYRLENIELRNGSQFKGIAQSRKTEKNFTGSWLSMVNAWEESVLREKTRRLSIVVDLIFAGFNLEEEC